MKLLLITPSKNKNKRLSAVFEVDGKIKVVDFGSKTGSTYTDHKDKTKKKNWILRHWHNIQKFGNDPMRPITLAFNILWNKPNIEDSIDSFKRVFRV